MLSRFGKVEACMSGLSESEGSESIAAGEVTVYMIDIDSTTLYIMNDN